MISETLRLWENGALTLPKEWRDKYETKHFLAQENDKGHLVIIPIVNTTLYEKDETTFGLTFPTGIEASELLDRFSLK